MGLLAWQIRTMLHPKAVQEFKFALDAIAPVMNDQRETRENKRKTLNMMVNALTEETFKLLPVAEQIIGIINMKQDICMEYADSQSQVEGILEWLSRMKAYRDILLGEVKNHREEYQLKV